MKKVVFIYLSYVLLFSCSKKSILSKEFDCLTSNIEKLEVVEDVNDVFSVALPNYWKTNLYQDTLQSSIFSADTTKQLTETFLIDVSYVKTKVQFNDVFKLNIEQENLADNLIQIASKDLIVKNYPSYLTISIGKKTNLKYQKLQLFTKLNNTHLIIAKAEIYGDSLVKERRCKALQIIETTKLIHNDR